MRSSNTRVVTFNQMLLRGDDQQIQPYNRTLKMWYLQVQPDLSIFCLELHDVNASCRDNCDKFCHSWAGGSTTTNSAALVSYDQG
jgi:hypothetical protein